MIVRLGEGVLVLGHAILAALGWAVVGWLPGYLLLEALRPAAGRLRNAAFAPVVSVGLVDLAAEFFYVCGVRLSPWNVVVPSVVVPALALLARVMIRPVAADPDAIRSSARDRGLLTAIAALGIVIWCIGVQHVSSVLPTDDGAHHGLFAARIERLGTLAPSKILTGDLPTGDPASHYYPLALHVQAAMVARMTGADVNTALTVGYVLASSIVLALGAYVLTRRVFPNHPDAAWVAAALSVTFPYWPHSVPAWGGVPVIIAMSEVPAAVDAAWRRREDGAAWANGVVLAVAGYGLFQEHNTELVAVGLFALILVAADRAAWRESGRLVLRSWLVGVALLAALLAPLLPALRRGASEATNFLGAGATASTTTTAHPTVADWVLIAGNPLVIVLAIAGAWHALRRRAAAGWFLCGAAAVVLWLLCLVHVPVLKEATVPWYSNALRVSYLFSYFECSFGAVGAVLIAAALARRWRRRLDVREQIAGMLPATLLALLAIPLLVLPAVGLARYAYQKGSLVGADQRAGFGYLARHVAPGDRVLNQSDDASGWMETLDRVTPLFAVKANVVPLDPERTWGDRWYLVTHAAQLATDQRAQAAARTWRVTYVYVNTRIFPNNHALLDPKALSASPAYREVWHRGTVTIFAVTI